jgi:superfamily II DNA/RNA helicase
MRFDELGLRDEILEAIDYMGFEQATEIQEKAIPLILENRDLLGCAQTGTGKTAAFILPVLQQMVEKKDDGLNTLIIVPTRELAKQIDQQIQGFSYFIPVTSMTIYGGDSTDWEQQKRALKGGVDIIVATPGKFISHLNMGYVQLDKLKHLILDEADRMLDMGFIDDIMKIIGQLPRERQTLMFSATMPSKIKKLAEQIMKQPEEITLALSKPAEGVLQGAYLVHSQQKIRLINNLITDKPDYASILIFSSTKKNVMEIVRSLKSNGFDVAGISSDFDQPQREEVLAKFRAKRIRILVATDVLSRGIDIKDINLVINYDVPGNAEDYVHRVGRTARAKTTGVALTLINEKDMADFAEIEKLIERQVLKLPLPQGFEPGPEWKIRGGSGKYYGNKRSFRGRGKKK